jgi:hypothetical protein
MAVTLCRRCRPNDGFVADDATFFYDVAVAAVANVAMLGDMRDTDDTDDNDLQRSPPPRRYRLDARRFRGPLHTPARNDHEQHESDDLAALVEIARALVTEGFTAWIYERVRSATPWPEAWDLRLVTQLDPDRARD